MCVPQPSPRGHLIVSPARVQHLRGEAVAGGILLMLRWFAHRRQLRALAALDDRLLDDIGVARADVERGFQTSFRRVYARRHMR